MGQRRDIISKARQITGGILANSPSADGSALRLLISADGQAKRADNAVQVGANNQVGAIMANLDATRQNMKNQMVDPLMAGVKGVMGGLKMGMEVGGALSGPAPVDMITPMQQQQVNFFTDGMPL